MELVQKALDTVRTVRDEWSKPGKGNNVSYREIVCLGLGGMGKEFAGNIMGYMGMGADNTMLGGTIGLRPMHMQQIKIVQDIINQIFVILRGKLVDNTRTRFGRFRPYIATIGFPLVLISVIFIFMPLETMGYAQKLLIATIFSSVVLWVQPLYNDTYTELVTVITPNSEERTKIIAINSLVYSFAPTVYYALTPVFANMTGGYTSIDTYRYVIAPFSIIGVGLSLFTAFGTKERVVASKNYVQKVKLWTGVKEIFRNKYWWIRSVSGWIGFFEDFNRNILQWTFIYSIQNTAPLGIINTIMGTAATIAMVVCPALLKRLDNRGVLLMHNLTNVGLVTCMLFTYKRPYLLFIFNYLNTIVNSLGIVYDGAMHSEVKDYQQYLSGRRMDFTFGVAGMIGLPITMLTGLVKPFMYERLGITTDYDILYNPEIHNQLFSVLCICSIIGAVLNLIPFFFYTLSREKHRNYVKVLRYRALFEDYEDDALNAQQIVEAVEDKRETFDFVAQPMPDLAQLKKAIQEAKGAPALERKDAIKAAKQAYQKGKKLLEQKEEAQIYLDEYHKFEKPEIHQRLEMARKLIAMGHQNLINLDREYLDLALAMPNSTPQEKKIRSTEVQYGQALLRMASNIKKNYPNGVEIPSQSEWDDAVAMPEDTKEQRQQKKKAIKLAEDRINTYHETLKPYLDAELLVKHEEMSKTLFVDVEARYEEAKAQVHLADEEYKKEIERKRELEKAQKESKKSLNNKNDRRKK